MNVLLRLLPVQQSQQQEVVPGHLGVRAGPHELWLRAGLQLARHPGARREPRPPTAAGRRAGVLVWGKRVAARHRSGWPRCGA